MAGLVKARAHGWTHGVFSVTPDICPAGNVAGDAVRHCLVADPRRSSLNLCPFAVRFVLGIGGSVYDAMTVDAMLQWIASQEIHGAEWTPLCLRCPSDHTPPGARLRP